MNIHEQVLEAATRVADPNWQFDLDDVVRALPHLNVSSVRTHVVSRCCTNAPKNHLHKWGYFRRVSRGRYELMPAYRNRPKTPAHRSQRIAALKDTIHVVVTKNDDSYTAECVELSAVTQGTSLDELFRNVQEAVALHLEGEDPADFGLQSNPRLQLIYDVQRAG
jgi:predicted RNase H-like HicB family nuclease